MIRARAGARLAPVGANLGDDFMYVEGLGSASMANGVVRVETFYRNARGEDVNGEDLVIPANRIGAIAGALQALIEQLRNETTAADANAPA